MFAAQSPNIGCTLLGSFKDAPMRQRDRRVDLVMNIGLSNWNCQGLTNLQSPVSRTETTTDIFPSFVCLTICVPPSRLSIVALALLSCKKYDINNQASKTKCKKYIACKHFV